MSVKYTVISIILAILVLLDIKLMSSPKTAVQGNRIGAISMLIAILVVLQTNGILNVPLIWAAMILGGIIGYFLAVKVTMIKMPQMVALLNGLGGGASALVAIVEIINRYPSMDVFTKFTSGLALAVGGVTLSGSLIAAAKLDRRISQRPTILPSHNLLTNIILIITAILIVIISTPINQGVAISSVILILSLVYGILFAIRVGGADMPITISLLNSFSGLAGAICGFTIAEPLLVSVGAIVGASGFILTKIMCTAMNRTLGDVLTGASLAPKGKKPLKVTKDAANAKKLQAQDQVVAQQPTTEAKAKETAKPTPASILKSAKKVIIVPGYGMAVAQAQSQVKHLMDTLEANGTEVKFAIHPVAGRMPGHMNVLLAEVDVPYDKLYEMDDINEEFKQADAAIIVGACDVVNPAANTAEGTPIYGMPVLQAQEAKNVIVCNLDTKPGYSGVDNTLYEMPHVHLILGNAADTVAKLTNELR